MGGLLLGGATAASVTNQKLGPLLLRPSDKAD